jgi:hypothetical protein
LVCNILDVQRVTDKENVGKTPSSLKQINDEKKQGNHSEAAGISKVENKNTSKLILEKKETIVKKKTTVKKKEDVHNGMIEGKRSL